MKYEVRFVSRTRHTIIPATIFLLPPQAFLRITCSFLRMDIQLTETIFLSRERTVSSSPVTVRVIKSNVVIKFRRLADCTVVSDLDVEESTRAGGRSIVIHHLARSLVARITACSGFSNFISCRAPPINSVISFTLSIIRKDSIGIRI